MPIVRPAREQRQRSPEREIREIEDTLRTAQQRITQRQIPREYWPATLPDPLPVATVIAKPPRQARWLRLASVATVCAGLSTWLVLQRHGFDIAVLTLTAWNVVRLFRVLLLGLDDGRA